MDPKAVSKAKDRLRVARNQLSEAEKTTDYQTFTDAWYLFLVAAKNVYTQLEQGAKANPQSRQWFAGKKNERKSDPLLQYLFQARDDDEHGIGKVTKLQPGGIGIGRAAPGHASGFTVKNFRVDGDMVSWDSMVSHDGKPILIETIPARAVLIPVNGRGNITYHPPIEHLGKPLTDNLPVPVGRLGLAYLEKLVSDAEAKAA